MKFTQTLPSLLLRTILCGAQIVFIFTPTRAFAEFGLPTPSPYTFGPEGRTIQDLVDFAPPIRMISFPAHQPIQATDQNGNKLFYNTAGKLIMSVGIDGSMVTYTAGGTRSFDADGKLIEETKAVQGTNRAETRNEHGEITGYSTKAFGDKVTQEFDADGNLLRTYAYTDYAKSTAWVRDELTQSKTVYNDIGQPEKDIDFEGNTVATYKYDEKKKIVSKTDIYNNVTSYDQYGRQKYTTNSKGEKVLEYRYRFDENGNNVLDKAVDLTPGIFGGDVTTFHNNMQIETRSKFGGVAQKFHYRGHTLVYAYDTRTNEVTWYNKYGRQSMATVDGEVIREHLYYKSRFVGYIDHRSNRIVLYQYERQDEEVKFFKASDMPTATEIEKYYEALCMMNDIIPTDVNSVKQSGGLVHNNTIPLNKPRAAAQRVMALNPAITNESFSDIKKNSIVKAKYNYSGGKLLSIVQQDLADGNGVNTKIYVGDMVFTTTKDMSARAAQYAQLWNAIMSGKSIADISAGSDDLAMLARSVKSLDMPGDRIPGLSDTQLANLMGWDIKAVNTAVCLKDIRARNANAGAHGNISIVYGYGDNLEENRLSAAGVTGTDANSITVGGLFANKMLDVSSPEARTSVTSRSATGGYIASLTPRGQNTAPENSYSAPVLPAGAAFIHTVNEVTRAYASNGNILYEMDRQTDKTTLFDAYARRTAVYGPGNQLQESYTYGNDGRIESSFRAGKDSTEADETTFYVGFGVANEDQTEITVFGNQTGKAAAVKNLFDVIAAGASIADAGIDVIEFVQTVRSITMNAATVLNMDTVQFCHLFGWDINAPGTDNSLREVRAMAQSAGFEGKLVLQYGNTLPVYVAKVSALNGGNTPLSFSEYSVIAPPTVIGAAQSNLLQSTGLSLIEALGRTIGSITRTMR